MEEQDLFESQVAAMVREHGQRQYGEPPADLWVRLAPQLTMTTPWWRRLFSMTSTSRHAVQPARHLALSYKIALLVLVLALIGGGTAVAATNTWGSLLAVLHFQDSVPAASGGKYTELHQKLTIDGVTFTLENASENANSVITSVTIVQPMNSHYSIDTATLTLKGTGIQLPQVVGDSMGVQPQDGMQGYSWVTYFSAKTIPSALKELHLHYSAPVLKNYKDTGKKVEFDFTIPAYQH